MKFGSRPKLEWSVMKTVLVVIGTRPDAIKLLPLYVAFKKASIPVLLCATFQHDDLLTQVLTLFEIIPDIRLDVMIKDQSLSYVTSTILEKMSAVITQVKPACIIVQGDTATAFSSALAAFYHKIPLGHVEAGLRTGDMYAPYPEEAYRRFISMVAAAHFAPTSLNVANLLAEGITRNSIFHTGNTVVDALMIIKNKIDHGFVVVRNQVHEIVNDARFHDKKLVLLTAHRRESFDGGLVRIFSAIKTFAQEHPDVLIIYPVHPNSNVRHALKETGLDTVPTVKLIEPLSYQDLVYLMMHVHWVMTDSGGIQEEAMSFGKKVIILRDATERMEGVLEGFGVLAGTSYDKVLSAIYTIYDAQTSPNVTFNNLYGDGHAAERIVSIVATHFLICHKIAPYINSVNL